MKLDNATISAKGKDIEVSTINIDGKALIIEGRFIRVARLLQEFYTEIDNPEYILSELKSRKIPIDILTFLQRFKDTGVRYNYRMRWDNLAVIKIVDFEDWRLHKIPKQTRRAIRRSLESGLECRPAELDDRLVNGITEIFNESPFRQGKRFWHYGKDFETIRKEMSRDFERSSFIGVYHSDELVGFIKLIYGDSYARMTQLISKRKHYKKYPNNLLIANAVQLCYERGIPYLIYGEFEYGNLGSKSLIEFKRNNGFEKMLIPRYFIPLSNKGEIVLKLKLQNGVKGIVPRSIVEKFLYIRKRWYEKYHGGY